MAKTESWLKHVCREIAQVFIDSHVSQKWLVIQRKPNSLSSFFFPLYTQKGNSGTQTGAGFPLVHLSHA